MVSVDCSSCEQIVILNLLDEFGAVLGSGGQPPYGVAGD